MRMRSTSPHYNLVQGEIASQFGPAVWGGAAERTLHFPVTLIHTIGNHDIVAIGEDGYNAPHELAGQGAFIKHLGPARWSFDMAGVRFVGMNWPLIQEWVEMRVQVQPDRIRVLVNSRVGYDKFLPGVPVPGGSLVEQPPSGGNAPLIGLAGAGIEFFAREWAAVFGRVDVWQRKYPEDYKPRRMGNTG